ncbi:hypothetical protein A2334_02845 [Candidatus Roizmanbacteria bacterium RIFOXYB2_FULL_38_10]|uniref:Aspartyl/glutamyl-tRNA(Asn/Gln) amidotransferase subunit B n=1 Tax=Candidatus Roizmanbacteria bacterium RIFOXYD1_FULL_38_12 TaxID=1802093 RepID=A0A1F7L0A8_9BACT|nr:MAG: hypothetical protein A3K47_02155 [Candidatus Roizmanbacteria bacterium RIFOXYA2_FULL_38_14]OGK63580.1 MAG: hypothetical protein A3K27_02155 [Candidatus Roizmanbacteria bacterium RIFOXYA1_FULL_37_12]OGK65426.1 MAG: hypothetical protein A3K38_02155 [Candidatus Roizmanbacteria bacterium RIFOXYB1_FULL_40_23]OGK69097.1 MAG: hypothetical protein A2334_02845 [Candidatus Roizmanbacteria bacterium RIFOXYB2_FULL_38_10]OGK69831.1 MAG: hypothetical protein A3K21_02160 [Candidatus Roizmanbacteria ba
MKQYKPVIGLEIHVELKTESGMFCQCKINQFTSLPNSHVCPVCLGLPGALPVPNKKAIEWTIKIAQALNCTINKHTKFDRKHYSYPDLPKGYQISQYDEPIAINGHLDFEANYGTNKNESKSFRIHRVHLEEDTGKLIHKGDDTLIDFNRSGTPLVEIVTEPDFSSSTDVKMFLEELHTIIRYLDVSDADMEKGTMRMEPNISVRVTSNDQISNSKQEPISKFQLPNYKVEVKNINSFNFVKRAIDYEVKRHIELLEQGKTPPQETRGWDSDHNKTYSQRTKEAAHDYRYFPDPDIPPFEFSDEYIESIRKTLVELPHTKMYRYIEILKLKPMDAYILTRDKNTTKKFEIAISNNLITKNNISPQTVANIFINKIGKQLPSKTDKAIVEEIFSLHKLKQDLSNFLNPEEVCEKVIQNNPNVVSDYKNGKQNAIMFLVGQVMREMKGKADASVVIAKLKSQISKIHLKSQN